MGAGGVQSIVLTEAQIKVILYLRGWGLKQLLHGYWGGGCIPYIIRDYSLDFINA